jgi:hypothetical protein
MIDVALQLAVRISSLYIALHCVYVVHTMIVRFGV